MLSEFVIRVEKCVIAVGRRYEAEHINLDLIHAFFTRYRFNNCCGPTLLAVKDENAWVFRQRWF